VAAAILCGTDLRSTLPQVIDPHIAALDAFADLSSQNRRLLLAAPGFMAIHVGTTVLACRLTIL
jgi:hypothetical protein